ncbi:helix-turn-helix transcriptional regulator [Marinobacter sp. NFXS9]|uniref:helix-turn-helix domain-containing protein n=1 Tax=Marinobacter sp. NFXS9 TaxID=2818433 RepID=UPI0032DF07DE
MALKFYDSPFHVAHEADVASKMAMKMDLSIMLTKLIEEKGWTQAQAAEKLNVHQSRISDLKNAKLDKFTIDSMFDMLDALGFRATTTASSAHEASILISDTAW